jgi:hypothetical protein
MEGVTLDPGSYIERLYTSKAGLTFQFFSLLKFHELTQYIHQVDAIYIGDRTFQLRTTTGVKDVAGLFGKEREADLFFVANCKEIAGQQAVSGVVINLSCVFLDSSNRDAFAQSQKLATALQLKDAANAIASYVHDHPNGKVKLTIEGPAQVFTGLRADSYVGNKPPKEPPNLDRSNYDAFVSALRTLAKQDDAAAGEFFKNFATYQDWLEFNRVKTDQQGSTKPGDRLNVGNLANSVWPENHGPSDLAARSIVQQHVLAGQAFMNLCEALKQISDTAGTITTEAQYDSFLDQIRHMIPKDVYWPAYFLKPTMVALIHLLSAKVVADSSVTKDGDCSIKLTLSLGSGAGAGHD